MKRVITFILSILLVSTFVGCGSDTQTYDYLSEPAQSTENQDIYNPIVLPKTTSFVEDIETLQIAAIGESSTSSSSVRQASSKDDAEEEEGSSEDDGEDQQDDDSDDDDSDDSDDGDDSTDDEETTDDDDTTTTDKTSIEPELLDFTRVGGIQVELNAKEYAFTIAVDNIAARLSPPTYKQNSDQTYTINISGYVLENNDLKKEDGVFTLSFVVPRLGGRSTVVLTSDSNILTNSAKDGMSVNADVTITKTDDIFGVNLVSDVFEVENRYRTRSFRSYISLVFELDKEDLY